MGSRTIGHTKSWNFTALEDLNNSDSFGIVSGLNLDYCGNEICSPGHFYGPTKRHSYLIHVIREGKGVFRSQEKEFPLHKNQAFLIRPEEVTYYEADSEDPWQYMWVGFHGYAAEKLVEKIGFSEDDPVVTFESVEGLYPIMMEMLEASQLTYSNYLIRLGGFFRFLGRMIELGGKPGDRTKLEYPQGVYVKQAMLFIMSNYPEKIKIDALASQIGITRNYLTKSFQKELGVSPQEFLINIRMERAAELLTSTSLPINEVAAKVGYSDALAFSKKFKEEYNLSPKSYRETKPEIARSSAKGGYEPKRL